MFKDIEKFERIFYQLNHRDFNFCDCYGICYLYNKHVLGKYIPEYLNENIYTDESIIDAYNKRKPEWTQVKNGKEVPGDIISIKIKKFPTHVGVVVKKGLMMHIAENRHTAIESYNSTKWKNRVDSFWRYEGSK